MSRMDLSTYIIKEGDNIQNIATLFLGESTYWHEIVTLNKLDYPFIIDEDKSKRATGYITFFRDPIHEEDITIPNGFIVKTEDGREYEVLETIIFVKEKESLDVKISSLNYGLIGEAVKNEITILGSTLMGIASILNKEDVTIFEHFSYTTGNVVFKRKELVEGDIIIPAGTEVSTAYNPETKTQIRRYKTTRNIILSEGSLEVEVEVRCTQKGDIGNIPSLQIKVLVDEILDIEGKNAISQVTNKEAFYNGNILNVKKPGDIILIPQIGNSGTLTDSNVGESSKEKLLYGEDLLLNNDGDLEIDKRGDLKSVLGVDNVAQAVKHRIDTLQGSLHYHPEFGNKFEDFIGVGSTLDQINLLKSEMKRIILSDPRVEKVGNIIIGVKNGLAIVDIEVDIIGSSIPNKLSFLIKGD